MIHYLDDIMWEYEGIICGFTARQEWGNEMFGWDALIDLLCVYDDLLFTNVYRRACLLTG